MVRTWHGRGTSTNATRDAGEVQGLLRDLEEVSPELALVVNEFQEELRSGEGFETEASWWRHVECRFALRCWLLHLEENLESVAVQIEALEGPSQVRKLQLLSQLSQAFESTTEPRLAKLPTAPRGVQVERRYNLSGREVEIFRLLVAWVVRESATCRSLCRFLSSHSGSDGESALCSLCRSSKLDVQDFLQEKRPYVTEGIVRIQDGYGDTKEPSISPEAVHALLGKDLTTEQRLKLSSTAIDAVIKGDDTDDRRQDAAATEERGSVEKETEAVPETTTEGQQDSVASESAEDESEFQQPYKDSLDYLNDQFSLLECEIRIAEHRRQSTKEDVGVEEPFLLRSRKINVFEHEAKRKLALARIHHRLKLTKEAGLEVPRLEVLLQKTKLDDFEKSVVVMLVGNTLSPKIQATLNVGERRFCVNAPLQVRVILETFCRDFKEEVQKRVYFYKSSRLASSGIIRIGAGARSGDLTGHTVHIDRRILDFVVGLDTEINEVVEGSNLYKPSATLEQLVLPEDMKQGILALVDNFEQFCRYRKSSGLDDVIAHGSGLVLMFCGPSGTGKTLMVNALAAHLEKRVLLVNFKTLYSHNDTGLHEEDGSNVLKLFREAEMSDAVLFFDECESLFSQRGSGGSSELTALLTAMERYEGIIFLATNRPFDLDEAMYRRITSVFTFSKPDHVQRLEIWKLYTQTGVPLALDIDWEKIAMKFALTGGYIKNAIVSALLLAISRNNVDPKVTEEDITGGCIMQVRGSLQMQSFAKRLVPRAGLDSLVLAPNLKQKLLEIVAFEKARPLLLESWGFGDPGSLAQLGSGRREAEVIRVFPRQICL
ncbi:ATP-dependent zinc metalloprotease FtsH [Durusdinium trenchii]|uniref:ATP-dependent zinc metalloprotease FtsH n=1 Tax=Durusdinium trenchii TaxID=1381693 RepID=A0ABP0SA18_9DINO